MTHLEALAYAQRFHRHLFGLPVDGPLPAVEITLMAGGQAKAVDYQGYRYLTQNPKTGSTYARMARTGRRISWVIDLASNQWIARIIDGTLTRLSP